MGRRSAERPATRPGDLLEALRARAPSVHCLTNRAADVFTADCLLALGARPSLTANPRDVADFTRAADALLVNLGTLDSEREAAIAPAIGAGRPWVLDPAHAEGSPRRVALTAELLEKGPAILRLNARELAALGREAGETGTVTLLSGARDLITDGTRSAHVTSGTPMMDRLTAMGCAMGAVAAAFLTVAPAFGAAVAAAAVFGAAGEKAAAVARGPGSFRPAFLDALYGLSPADLETEIPDA